MFVASNRAMKRRVQVQAVGTRKAATSGVRKKGLWVK